jgi:integral membrane protein (TIGR01906 family)
MRTIGVIAKYIFVISLPVLFLSASIAWGFNSLWIYEHGFQKYNVSQTSGLSPAELRTVGREMIAYFNSNEEYIHIRIERGSDSFDLFTNEEQIHFKDVKRLVRLNYTILLIAFFIFLSYVLVSIFWRKGKNRGRLAKSVIWGSGISILLILVMGLASFADFDQIFLQFHYLVFTNPYWSAEGYMLILFGDLWFDTVLIGIGFMAGLAVISSVPAFIYLRRSKGRQLLS